MKKPARLVRIEKIQEAMNTLSLEITAEQAKCKHKKATKTHRSNTNDYDRVPTEYWTEFKCPECLKYWTEEGSR